MKINTVFIKIFRSIFAKSELVSDELFAKCTYFLSFGKTLNLKRPISFNEHICSIRISENTVKYSDYVDKASVRNYVQSTIGDKYLIPIVGIYNSFDEVPFNELPTSFVLKCTHASGYNIIVPDKNNFDVDIARKKVQKWMQTNFYYVNREKNYKNIVPRIIIDKFIVTEDPLKEYKIFCFRGIPKFISVNIFTKTGRRIAIYNESWEYMPIDIGYKTAGDVIDRPDNFDELLDVAKRLSMPFDFVRVDLYNNNNKILFSELTFTPGGGLLKIQPNEWDIYFGRMFRDQ